MNEDCDNVDTAILRGIFTKRMSIAPSYTLILAIRSVAVC